MIDLDTSAFIKLYFLEKGSELVQQCVLDQDEPLPVWELLEAEFVNACRLKAFWKDITPAQAERQIQLFAQRQRRGLYFVPDPDRGALMSAFRVYSSHIPRFGCRTMDILHVACAKLLDVSCLVSFDERQRALAAHAGLSIMPKRQA